MSSSLTPLERENIKLIGFCTVFALILHDDLISYGLLCKIDFIGWLICAIGYGVTVYGKLQPICGALNHPEGRLHWLLRTTVSLFVCLVLNSDFDVFIQFLLFLVAEVFLFVRLFVIHEEKGGREIFVDIPEFNFLSPLLVTSKI